MRAVLTLRERVRASDMLWNPLHSVTTGRGHSCKLTTSKTRHTVLPYIKAGLAETFRVRYWTAATRLASSARSAVRSCIA